MIIISWGMAQCGTTTGGGAAPQSSIPLPNEQDPITVSAPDADGIVRVTGSAGAVPNSAIVVVEVGVTLSSSVSVEFCETQIDKLIRTECSSSLPECPSLDADNRCQETAADDGSFSLQVPAAVEDNILIYYLDPETCAETAAYTVVVAEDVLSIGMEVDDVVYERGDDTILFFGASTDDTAMLMAYNLSDQTYYTNSLPALVGDIVSTDYFKTASDEDYAVIITDQKIILASEVSYETAGLSGFKEIVDSAGFSIAGGRYLGTFASQSDDYTLGTRNVNQVFTYFDRVMLVFEYADDITDLQWGTFGDYGEIVTQTLPVNFLIVEEYFSDFTTENITSIPFFEFMNDNSLVMVIGFEHEGTTRYVVLKRDYDYRDAYGTALDFTDLNTRMIVLGPSTEEVVVNLVSGYSGDSQDPYALVILKPTDQDITIVDVSSDTLTCFDDDVIELADFTGPDGDNECADSGETDEIQAAASDLDVSDVSVMDVLLDDDNYGELFVVGSGNAGSRFMTQYGTDSVYETDEVVSAINPVFASYYSAGNAMVVIDAGNDLDYITNIILYELATTPSSY